VSPEPPRRRTRAVGVVLPVHDEEDLLPGALHALEDAVAALPTALSVRTVVVLDSCGDASAGIAGRWADRRGALVLPRDCRSVGLARQAGCRAVLAGWPEMEPAQIWLATTDADSRVPPDWLTVQLHAHEAGVDLWAGRVRVAEKSATIQRWSERYAAEGGPIHGASLGFSAALYSELGGFRGLAHGEDRDLALRATAAGFRIRHAAKAVVTTSSRRLGRAPHGFASVLHVTEQQLGSATISRQKCVGSSLAG
jgi:Glycosyl transferase family 2